ncbi:hypothetical protein DFH08DRAFT_388511 [Mycena albidolilacea]|uniref:Uncharacterized protein n=1 Tax=Mycena albidolilacea TaxID=1033008 RepID=A0AAD6ZFG7_9AGAR|nr:hypothetical protein DFH08DRAFT_388511 [Mycena albidolilacea]
MQTLIPLQSNEEGSVGSHKPLAADIVVPEGGFEAWRTIIGAWLVLFATFGYVFTFGVYEDFYARECLADYSPSTYHG